ncbi:hypothetical protein FRACYDRAFT_237729 [Fragilariopsis cylindrus CCMP1102]|uniref:Uncharacterized protein n=1 Tax=Fragilariopsis cylindrus CCMP1102 TaxID=635003 RepID=A0A1E7FGL7_9STRA|nr:hypothetical protein FRACYDRAFT_237729 [Fragilariopsis cylindrus CCMP1102]|eukprot:OEU17319.1 hypothetical protein FRACYDRAFT_237729 [Fragilariopsis cylindrus CCMP1102]
MTRKHWTISIINTRWMLIFLLLNITSLTLVVYQLGHLPEITSTENGVPYPNYSLDSFTQQHLARRQDEPRYKKKKYEVDDDDDWFDRDRWNSHSSENVVSPAFEKCFYIEDACQFGEKWAYYDRSSKDNDNNGYHPTLNIAFRKKGEARPTVGLITPTNTTSIRLMRDVEDVFGNGSRQKCLYSTVTNHIVLNGVHTHMLGEKWRNTLLESHRAFLGLYSDNYPLPFLSLMESSNCQCMKRIFFCGFKEVSGTERLHRGLTNVLNVEPSDQIFTTNYHDVDSSSSNDESEDSTLVGAQKKNINNSIVDYGVLKKDVRTRAIDRNEPMHSLVRQLRLSMYAEHVDKNILSMTASDQDDILEGWKVVGLTQRTLRRVWMDIDQSLKACRKNFSSHKVLCVVVNLEDDEMNSPIQHMVVHGGLDALIGIHGAQMTEAIFMKEGSLVVEILPFVLGVNRMGHWTRSKNVQQQQQITLKHCLLEKGNMWSDRDFTVPVDAVTDILNRFVVNKPNQCYDFERAAADDYVLYNVNCVEDDTKSTIEDPDTISTQSKKSVHHFYRTQDWQMEKTHSYEKDWKLPEEKKKPRGIRIG